MSKFNFDFLNVSDIADDKLRAKFEDKTQESVLRVAGILNDPDCPGSLTLAEVMVVYARAYGEDQLPSEVTVRAWLNKAKSGGLISKPSKQSYGPKGGVSVADDEGEDLHVEVTTEVDPLA